MPHARILLILLAALLALAVHGPAVAAGDHHHHNVVGGAVPSATDEVHPALQAGASEAGCPQHAGLAHHDSESCCGVGCSTAAIDSLEGLPARTDAARPVPAPADRMPPPPGGRLFHPPRPAA